MVTLNVTQLHRVVFRKKATAAGSWETFTIEADSLGQDTVATINIAPRKQSRASQIGSTEHPISGTFDSLAASITFLADNFYIIGKALDRWTAATYAGHDANAGQVVLGDGATSAMAAIIPWSFKVFAMTVPQQTSKSAAATQALMTTLSSAQARPQRLRSPSTQSSTTQHSTALTVTSKRPSASANMTLLSRSASTLRLAIMMQSRRARSL